VPGESRWKGEDDIWDVKLAGGLVDIDFIAQRFRSYMARTVSAPCSFS